VSVLLCECSLWCVVSVSGMLCVASCGKLLCVVCCEWSVVSDVLCVVCCAWSVVSAVLCVACCALCDEANNGNKQRHDSHNKCGKQHNNTHNKRCPVVRLTIHRTTRHNIQRTTHHLHAKPTLTTSVVSVSGML